MDGCARRYRHCVMAGEIELLVLTTYRCKGVLAMQINVVALLGEIVVLEYDINYAYRSVVGNGSSDAQEELRGTMLIRSVHSRI